ncbi:MAG TPA: hypothetical protein VNO55_00745 [Polyangia bacterium]|nr:hypothetical protein [Polyangia bacterium]
MRANALLGGSTLFLAAVALVSDGCAPGGGASPDAPGVADAGPSPPPAERDAPAPEGDAARAIDSALAPEAAVPEPASDGGASSSDGNFFGASRCASGAFMFCEDFEAPALDPARWDYIGGNASNGSGFAAVDSTRAARGGRSLRLHTELNQKGSGAQVKAKQPDPRLGDGFYLRAFLYFAQPVPDHHLNYFNVVDFTAQTGGMFSLGSLDGKLGMVEFGPHNGDHAALGDPLIVGRWFCVEWQVHPAASELRVWVDESEVPSLHVTDWSPSRFTNFFMEFISYQGAYDLWIDELAYDSQRIGCTR